MHGGVKPRERSLRDEHIRYNWPTEKAISIGIVGRNYHLIGQFGGLTGNDLNQRPPVQIHERLVESHPHALPACQYDSAQVRIQAFLPHAS